MANRIVLDTPKFKGEFDFDINSEPLTNLEWRWVKKISGYLPLTLKEGLRGSDPDVYVAFAVVALARAGKIQKTDALAVADYFDEQPFGGSITIFLEDEEDDEEDPPAESATLKPTEPPSENTGGSSSQTSDPSGPPLSRIGALG